MGGLRQARRAACHHGRRPVRQHCDLLLDFGGLWPIDRKESLANPLASKQRAPIRWPHRKEPQSAGLKGKRRTTNTYNQKRHGATPEGSQLCSSCPSIQCSLCCGYDGISVGNVWGCCVSGQCLVRRFFHPLRSGLSYPFKRQNLLTPPELRRWLSARPTASATRLL